MSTLLKINMHIPTSVGLLSLTVTYKLRSNRFQILSVTHNLGLTPILGRPSLLLIASLTLIFLLKFYV